jgi:hypothetical protein
MMMMMCEGFAVIRVDFSNKDNNVAKKSANWMKMLIIKFKKYYKYRLHDLTI